MVKSASGLLATGQTNTPLRSLIWLASMQRPDGSMPQNSWINGDAYWHGKQLDEVAAPVLLAWRLKQANALGLFDPWTLVRRAASYLILNGPITGQERWEETSGYSPSTLASIIAALVCAAEFAAQRLDQGVSDFVLDYADWLSSHLEEWLVTSCGELVPGKPHHYIRITPADPALPNVAADPNSALIQLNNGGGEHPARNIVSTDFLELVRLGIRDANDPLICASLEVIDHVLKHDLPQGPCWRRYNHDGYGQKADGSAFDGSGIGRCWPLLTGERAHYELAAGRDPLPYLRCLESFANEGGMLPEQVWDAEDLAEAHMRRGQPTGSAMPLCWAHAEYLMLVHSREKGEIFECPSPVRARYAVGKKDSDVEIWTHAFQPPSIRKNKGLRIITSSPCLVRWTVDGWSSFTDSEGSDSGLGLWHVDLPTQQLPPNATVDFTICQKHKWEGHNFRVTISYGNL
jgi:glucoamylase